MAACNGIMHPLAKAMGRYGMALPTAAAQPVFHHRNAIDAPERLAVGDEEGGAEDAARHCGFDFLFRAILERGVLEPLRQSRAVHATRLRDLEHGCRIADVAGFG